MNKTFTMDDVQIMYEDNSIIVVNKPQNMPSQSDETGDTDLLSLLKEYVKVKYNKAGEAYVGLVHRLDRPTGGVMVFARNSKCAARLCEQIKDGTMEKTYYTVLVGAPRDAKGTLVTYLKKNSLTNVVYVATSGTVDAKRAELSYKVLENFHDVVSLVEVKLETGRSHQIRVQFSSYNTPVFGDAKYGGDKLAKGYNMALWAVKLCFEHPVTKEKMVFVSYPPQEKEPWSRFNLNKHLDVFRDNDDE